MIPVHIPEWTLNQDAVGVAVFVVLLVLVLQISHRGAPFFDADSDRLVGSYGFAFICNAANPA